MKFMTSEGLYAYILVLRSQIVIYFIQKELASINGCLYRLASVQCIP